MSPEARGPAAGGDRGGFASFLEANKDALLRFIRWKGIPDHDVENVNQESWLSLVSYWQRRGAPESDEHARNLLFQIANRRIADYWRGLGRAQHVESWDPEVHDQPDPSSTKQYDGIVEYLTKHDTRPALTPKQETALRLVYLEGWNQQEAAALMNIKTNALEKLLIRARETIRQARQATKTRTEEGTR